MPSYYFRSTGSTAWNLASNWSLTDGGLATGAVPTNADDAFFSNNSGNCVLNAASLVCKTLDFTKGTGYSNIFTLTNGVTVSGNITLSSAMTIIGTGTLTVNATATLTSNGKTWTGALATSNGNTYTFADNWQFNGSYVQSGTSVVNGGGNILSVGGSVTFGSGGGSASGNIIINMNGTGTLTGIGCTISEIRFAGTITFTGISTNTTTYTYISGTVAISGTITQTTGGTGITFNNCGTLTFGTLSVNAGIVCTFTLSGTNPNINFSTITIAATSVVTWAGTGNITCGTLNLNSNGNFTLIAGKSFTINTAFTSIAGTSATHTPIKSSVGGTKAILTLTQGAAQNLGFVNFTDIDASLGKTICTFNGTIATSNNVRLLPTDVQTISY